MGAPGGVNVDRGTGSSRSRAVNQSGGGGDDDIPDKLASAAPLGSHEDPFLRPRNHEETRCRCCRCRCGSACSSVRWRCRGLPPVPVLSPCLPSVAPGSRGRRGRGVGFRGARCRRRPPLLPALPGGRGKFSAPGLAVLLGRALVTASRGLAVAVYRAAISRAPAPLLQHTEQEPPPGDTGNNPSDTPPKKGTLEAPAT